MPPKMQAPSNASMIRGIIIFVLDRQNPTHMDAHYFLTLSTLLASSAIANGQTLNNGSSSPTVGETFTQYQDGYMAPGTTGTGQIWDFSSLSQGTIMTSTYVTPASTGLAATFPGANLASDDGAGNYGYYATSSGGFDIVGVYAGSVSVSIPYQNPERILTYPCSYGTSWNDNLGSNFSSLGTPVTRTGSITGIADGAGTLIMPFGTVTNVLRVKTIEDFSDDVDGLYTVDYLFTNYLFYKPGIHLPILSVYDQITTTAGSPSTNQLIVWLDGASIGIAETPANTIGIDLFPNPASGSTSLVFSSEGGGLQLEVLDAQGRAVRTEQLNDMAIGIERHDMDLGALPAGIYQVRLLAANGQQGVRRLVIE